MGWIDAELVLVALAAMLSPTTLSFSVLSLVLSDRPRRSGFWFYLGAFGATLGIGIVAALVLGDRAATDHPNEPKTWVAIIDIVAAVLLAVWIVRVRRRPPNPARAEAMITQMTRITGSPAIVIVGAGAALANPGGFVPLALKMISETDPGIAEYIVEWILFTIVSLLPMAVALIMLVVAPGPAMHVLHRARDWLVGNARTVAAVIVGLLAAALLRNGIAGLVA
jgi:hypothetical protein